MNVGEARPSCFILTSDLKGSVNFVVFDYCYGDDVNHDDDDDTISITERNATENVNVCICLFIC